MKSLILALFGLSLCSITQPVAARELAVDLSKTVVPITASFDGSELLLFGAADPKADIVVIVRGPQHDELVRRKERVMGVWVNGAEMTFKNVPSYYFMASNRPIEEFVSPELARQRQIGYEEMILTLKNENALADQDKNSVSQFHDALIRVKKHQGLYGNKTGNVHFIGNRLFRTELKFPNNIPVGSYAVDVFVFRDGKIADEKTTILGVQKIGIEAEVYDFAHRHALPYGVLAILLAGMAGWLANTIFRKG
ncbi:MAG: TIGR02186 family protein [Rhodospirillaceae bacterium]|nr:TIGR02186 family protein [Rhodospirillaceae bacterium]MBL6931982.1 TIGR02186 family protein [Rhodospirillales bacterium]